MITAVKVYIWFSCNPQFEKKNPTIIYSADEFLIFFRKQFINLNVSIINNSFEYELIIKNFQLLLNM